MTRILPGIRKYKNLDARKQKITLENVLTMTAGFQWNELAIDYANPQNDLNKILRSRDWTRHVIDSPMSHAPGDYLNYSSGCTLL
ncbi:MAG: beta-lactamase family protein [Gammaproteobacteria bacterium]|nr:beta-lactamase family protein [Gammaproteobacteria bacterium]